MSSLLEIVKNFEGKKIAVIGDVMLDKYIFGNVSRISPEAPVLIVKTDKDVYAPGGAGNTSANITSLGGQAYLVGVVGSEIDGTGGTLKGILHKRGIHVDGVVASHLRQTTVKTRVIVQNQQIVRIDHEDDDYIRGVVERAVVEKIDSVLGDSDVVVVSDYAKGVVTKDVMSYLIPLAQSANKCVIIDPRPRNKLFYKNCDFITPNLSEAKEMVGDCEDYKELGRKLMKEICCNVLLTKGEHGMSLFTKHGTESFVCEDSEAITKEVYDITGAGDTVAAAFALSLAAGASYSEAAKIANFAAGIVVSKFGSATTTSDELIKVINNYKT